jgi:Raf kinase inhibitor-like YbhB/YbcL family protein
MPLPLVMKIQAFEDGGIVPARYGCFGDNVPPGFVCKNVPDNTASLALVFHDVDLAVDGSPEAGALWTVWNIPPDVGDVPDGWLPPGAIVGRNVENRNAYLGPGAPPGPRYHHYVFELFALDSELDLPPSAGRAELLRAMEGHVLDKAAYVGRFRRGDESRERRAI